MVYAGERAGIQRHHRARHGRSGALARRPQAPAGPGCADAGRRAVQHRSQDGLQEGHGQARRRGRQGARHRRRRCGHRRDHQLHQHFEPRCDDRRRSGRAEGQRPRPQAQALGQDLAGTWLAGGHRLSGQVRAPDRSRRARLRSGRLWLHHLHRQFGAARAADQQGDQRQRHRRRQRALGQSQFRRSGLARRPRQFPCIAAAGGRLCAAGNGDRGHHHHRNRAGPKRPGRDARRSVAEQSGNRRPSRRQYRPRDVRTPLCQRL